MPVSARGSRRPDGDADLTMRVPFLDVQAAYRELKEELNAAVTRVAASGQYILGPEVEAFEAAFARFTGTRYCIGVGSGLAALHFSLAAMGVGPEDEVIVPSNTFIATWLAVSQTGGRPVPVEPDVTTNNIDPSKIEAAITPATKAILPVHLYGQPADMEPIRTVAREYGLAVLEDAAQAHGARYQGRRVGGWGNAAAWSFYPGKNLGALGDAGAVTTDDAMLADRVRLLRNYGWRQKNVSECKGFNNRLDEVQAAVLSVKLQRLDEWNDRRRSLAELYLKELDTTALVLPVVPRDMEPSWHLFVVRSQQRDRLLTHLQASGIEVALHYPIPPHRQAAYTELNLGPGSLPISEALHHEVLSLPIGPHLREPGAWTVIEAVRSLEVR